MARRRYVDGVRRQVTFERKVEEIGRHQVESERPMDEIEFDEHVEDDVLRLIFTACHPVLAREARAALTLKMVGGLSTEQIARAILVATPTVAARITRAKKALSDANVPFEVPVGAELAARLASVLEVVYLIFNERYSATSGESWIRGDLCEEAMRLGRMRSTLAPNEPEAHGLIALMEIQASRLRARTVLAARSSRCSRLVLNAARLWCEFVLNTLADSQAPWRNTSSNAASGEQDAIADVSETIRSPTSTDLL